jgi:hypothetical protein
METLWIFYLWNTNHDYMKKPFLIFCLALSACSTPKQIEATQQQQMAEDYKTCIEQYGFKPKSDAARNCMLQIELARQQCTSYRYNDYPYYPRIGTSFYYLHR